MATSHEVTCITITPNAEAFERITHIGGQDPRGRSWRLPLDEAIDGILNGQWTFFTVVSGLRYNLMVAYSRRGYRYLRAEVDKEEPVTLLQLPVCGGP